jgi:hypothetical protein
VIKLANEQTIIKCVILGSREFSGRTGAKFASLALLDLENGKFLQPSVPIDVLADAGIEGPSMTEVVEVHLEDSGFAKKIVGFKKTDLTYELKLVSE